MTAIARTSKEKNTMGENDVPVAGRWLLSRGNRQYRFECIGKTHGMNTNSKKKVTDYLVKRIIRSMHIAFVLISKI